MNKIKQSQNKIILQYLLDGNSITPIDALSLCGCFRLGARIYDLKKQGFEIETSTICRNGKHFASYRIKTN